MGGMLLLLVVGAGGRGLGVLKGRLLGGFVGGVVFGEVGLGGFDGAAGHGARGGDVGGVAREGVVRFGVAVGVFGAALGGGGAVEDVEGGVGVGGGVDEAFVVSVGGEDVSIGGAQ